jgi:hypothetical protein
MPIYIYQVENADGSDGEVFEVEQSATAAALSVHPLTGAPVRRIFQAPHLAGAHNERLVKTKLHDSAELSRLGFTRYERDSATGSYHKTAGTDPSAPNIFGGKHDFRE